MNTTSTKLQIRTAKYPMHVKVLSKHGGNIAWGRYRIQAVVNHKEQCND